MARTTKKSKQATKSTKKRNNTGKGKTSPQKNQNDDSESEHPSTSESEDDPKEMSLNHMSDEGSSGSTSKKKSPNGKKNSPAMKVSSIASSSSKKQGKDNKDGSPSSAVEDQPIKKESSSFSKRLAQVEGEKLSYCLEILHETIIQMEAEEIDPKIVDESVVTHLAHQILRVDKMEELIDSDEPSELLALIGKLMEASNSAEVFAKSTPFVDSLLYVIECYHHQLEFSTTMATDETYKTAWCTHYCFELSLYLMLGLLERAALASEFLKSATRDSLKKAFCSMAAILPNDELLLTQEMTLEVVARVSHSLAGNKSTMEELKELNEPFPLVVRLRMEATRAEILATLKDLRSLLTTINTTNSHIRSFTIVRIHNLGDVPSKKKSVAVKTWLDCGERAICFHGNETFVRFRLATVRQVAIRESDGILTFRVAEPPATLQSLLGNGNTTEEMLVGFEFTGGINDARVARAFLQPRLGAADGKAGDIGVFVESKNNDSVLAETNAMGAPPPRALFAVATTKQMRSARPDPKMVLEATAAALTKTQQKDSRIGTELIINDDPSISSLSSPDMTLPNTPAMQVIPSKTVTPRRRSGRRSDSLLAIRDRPRPTVTYGNRGSRSTSVAPLIDPFGEAYSTSPGNVSLGGGSLGGGSFMDGIDDIEHTFHANESISSTIKRRTGTAKQPASTTKSNKRVTPSHPTPSSTTGRKAARMRLGENDSSTEHSVIQPIDLDVGLENGSYTEPPSPLPDILPQVSDTSLASAERKRKIDNVMKDKENEPYESIISGHPPSKKGRTGLSKISRNEGAWGADYSFDQSLDASIILPDVPMDKLQKTKSKTLDSPILSIQRPEDIENNFLRMENHLPSQHHDKVSLKNPPTPSKSHIEKEFYDTHSPMGLGDIPLFGESGGGLLNTRLDALDDDDDDLGEDGFDDENVLSALVKEIVEMQKQRSARRAAKLLEVIANSSAQQLSTYISQWRQFAAFNGGDATSTLRESLNALSAATEPVISSINERLAAANAAEQDIRNRAEQLRTATAAFIHEAKTTAATRAKEAAAARQAIGALRHSTMTRVLRSMSGGSNGNHRYGSTEGGRKEDLLRLLSF